MLEEVGLAFLPAVRLPSPITWGLRTVSVRILLGRVSLEDTPLCKMRTGSWWSVSQGVGTHDPGYPFEIRR
jgi:hypothetical protein